MTATESPAVPTIAETAAAGQRVLDEVGKAIVGKTEPLTLVLLVSRFKGVPGALLAGALTPLGLVVANLPSALLGTVLSTVEAQRIVGTLALLRAWRSRADVQLDRVALVVGGGFLAVHALFWATADATEDATPQGSLPFAAACFGSLSGVIQCAQSVSSCGVRSLHRRRVMGSLPASGLPPGVQGGPTQLLAGWRCCAFDPARARRRSQARGPTGLSGVGRSVSSP